MCGSKNYTYGDSVWKDKLTKYGTYNITYDEIGNPINYRNGITFSWKNGRWLASTTLSDNTTVTYQYNASGMRTKKMIGSTVTNYYYDSNNNLIGLKSGSDVAFFYYGADNSPVSMKYNNNMYYDGKNLQGDIVKILDSNGSAVASYYYDAWGTITRKTVTNTTIDTLSPFRYRGYVYDTDTGLYYLQSRYYDPQTGRFINADDNEYICASGAVLSANIFIYCENNTISSYDPNGNFSIRGTIRDLVRLISCNDYSLSITKSNNKYIKELFKIAGFYKDKKGIFHTYQDCLQQYGGYNSLYDIIFDLGTSMKAVNFPFTCRANNKEYIFWAWKGDYLNLGAGAELGFYKRLKILGYKTDHWVVDQNFKFKMSMVLKHKGKKIINYAPKKHKWWLTGFNPNKQNVKATDLSVKYTVYFENHKNIFKSFYDTWKKHKKMEKWKKWSFYPQKYKAVLKF